MRFSPRLKGRLERPIWLHAVSVGEAKVAKNLYSLLKHEFPEKNVVISTVTPTGQKIVKSFIKEPDWAIYLPLDFSFIVSKFIEVINPSVFISMETEIWPNLIYFLYKNNTPVIIINGRISPSSYIGYRIVKFLLKPILNRIKLFCMQTEKDFQRIVALGAAENRVKVTGNMKFDFQIQESNIQKLDLGLNDEDLLLIAGSTHPGEEEIILEAYKDLSKEFSNLRLLIAPRHIERTVQIKQIVSKYALESIRISQISPNCSTGQKTILILDTIGQLSGIYKVADIVFIGGSFVKKGGQNILEPALFGKPILFGPFMFNFAQIKDLFLEKAGAICVNNKLELEKNLRWLLWNAEERRKIGEKAEKIIVENRGASYRTLQLLKEFIK